MHSLKPLDLLRIDPDGQHPASSAHDGSTTAPATVHRVEDRLQKLTSIQMRSNLLRASYDNRKQFILLLETRHRYTERLSRSICVHTSDKQCVFAVRLQECY